jgi:type VI secretion system protein ImpC
MRLLLCGDFSGRAAQAAPGLRDTASLPARPVLRIDVDNLDAVMARIEPAIPLPIGDDTVSAAFGSLDDFHPDALFDRLALFARLRSLRGRLLDPASFEQASAELLRTGAESDAQSLQRLMGSPAPTPVPAGKPDATGIDALIRRIVGPHIVPSHGARQAPLVQAVDMTISGQMRALLHAPQFQALEAAWRSLQFLVARLELDEMLQLHIFDVTRAELDAAAAEPELERSGLWQALIERQGIGAGGPGWSMLVVLEAFGPSQADVSTLASLAALSAAAGAPVVATAAPSLLGCDTPPLPVDSQTWPGLDAADQQRWQALRRSPLAPWIGLVAPRVLLRLPYGKSTDPVERFDFDEMVGVDPAKALLWGHPAAGCAALAGRAFTDAGWRMALAEHLDLEDLPAWIYTRDGERHMYPGAEVWLGERGGQALLAQGVMPLVSRRDRPAARLMQWRSIAEPAAALAGPWV